MKKIIALCLTIVMLLGMVPMMASADEVTYFSGVSLALRESIAINFKADHASIADTFTKVEFVKNGNVVQTVDTLPAADSNGKAAFVCNKIAPSEMGTDITAKLYLGDTVADEVTASVYDYCAAVLADEAAAAELKTLVVDMLNYGAATQTYINDTNALVNAQLTPEQLALGTAADAELSLTDKTVLGEDPANVSVNWTSAALSLRESVAITYKFTATSVEGLSITLACGESSWTVDSFTDLGNNAYSVRFVGLNPAMMRDEVTAVAKISDAEVSPVLTYSIESYAAQVVADTAADADLVALVKAMMRYGDAAVEYVASGTTTNKNIYIQAEDATLMTTGDSTAANTTQAPVAVYEVTETTCAANADGNAVRTYIGNTTTQADDAPAHLSFDVTPAEDGEYSIWVKYYSNGNPSRAYMKVEGLHTSWINTRFGGTGFTPNSNASYSWIKVYAANWEAGETYTVGLRSRDIYLYIDEFVVTSDASFDPATHTHNYDWVYTDEQHWKEATCCDGITTEKVAHTHTAGVCECGHELAYLTVTFQAEDATLMTTGDSTAANTTQAPVAVYEVTETTCKASADGNAVRMNIGNTTTQADDAPAHLSFDVTPTVDGEYSIWVKYYSTAATTSASRVYLKVEGVGTTWVNTRIPGTGFTLGSNANSGWLKLSTANWEAGETYTVGLRARDITLYIDEFLVTNDSTYTPS